MNHIINSGDEHVSNRGLAITSARPTQRRPILRAQEARPTVRIDTFKMIQSALAQRRKKIINGTRDANWSLDCSHHHFCPILLAQDSLPKWPLRAVHNSQLEGLCLRSAVFEERPSSAALQLMTMKYPRKRFQMPMVESLEIQSKIRYDYRRVTRLWFMTLIICH
jgi:hypothetical protein